MLSDPQRIAFLVMLALTTFQKSIAFADEKTCIENVLLSKKLTPSNETQVISAATDDYDFIISINSNQTVERDDLECATQYNVLSVRYLLDNIQNELFSQCGIYVDDYQYLTRGITDFRDDDGGVKYCHKSYSDSFALFAIRNHDTALTSNKILIGQYLASTLGIEGFTLSDYLSALSQTDENQYEFEAGVNTFEAGSECFNINHDALLEAVDGSDEYTFLPFGLKISSFEFHNEILKGTPNKNHISPARMCSIQLVVQLYP